MKKKTVLWLLAGIALATGLCVSAVLISGGRSSTPDTAVISATEISVEQKDGDNASGKAENKPAEPESAGESNSKPVPENTSEIDDFKESETPESELPSAVESSAAPDSVPIADSKPTVSDSKPTVSDSKPQSSESVVSTPAAPSVPESAPDSIGSGVSVPAQPTCPSCGSTEHTTHPVEPGTVTDPVPEGGNMDKDTVLEVTPNTGENGAGNATIGK